LTRICVSVLGFDNADKACCGAIGPERGIINCQSFITACPDRDKYFFWDPYHPSQAGYQILADEFFEGSTYISPMNIKQLFHL
jgi:phospholipase/lecithinase/hemolysin